MRARPSTTPLGGAILLAFAACGPGEPEGEEPGYAGPPPPVAPAVPVEVGLRFTEISAEAGIDFEHRNGAFGEKWMPETLGSGAAFLDYDVDGDPDLFLVNSDWWPGRDYRGERPTQRLYRNLGDGRFEDATAAAGLELSLYGMGAAVADYDGDGDPDLYITAVGPNRLLRNDAGVFTDVTARLGVAGRSTPRASRVVDGGGLGRCRPGRMARPVRVQLRALDAGGPISSPPSTAQPSRTRPPSSTRGNPAGSTGTGATERPSPTSRWRRASTTRTARRSASP